MRLIMLAGLAAGAVSRSKADGHAMASFTVVAAPRWPLAWQ